MRMEDPIVVNLKLEMIRKQISGEELSENMGISLATFYKRMDDPDKFKVGELKKGCKFLHVDLGDLVRRRS